MILYFVTYALSTNRVCENIATVTHCFYELSAQHITVQSSVLSHSTLVSLYCPGVSATISTAPPIIYLFM